MRTFNPITPEQLAKEKELSDVVDVRAKELDAAREAARAIPISDHQARTAAIQVRRNAYDAWEAAASALDDFYKSTPLFS